MNPFSDPSRFERRAPPCALVIFGANGDLTKRKLIPALYRLAQQRRIPPNFAVLGNSRTAMTDEEFRSKMCDSAKQFLGESSFDQKLWDDFARGLYYLAGDLTDANFYEQLAKRLAELQTKHQTGGNIIFYLSTQPSYYQRVTEGLGAVHLQDPKVGQSGQDGQQGGEGWRRVVIEKPFGHDLASARELDSAIHAVFNEQQVYRIDHYLGKETVQNILAFRFGNGIFEPLWNNRFIKSVQITAAESIGVEGRGSYYQEAGALRDMIQNHLLQVMATIGMEPLPAFEANAVRDERAKFLRSVRIMKPSEVPLYAVAGQYGPGEDAKEMPAFRGEPGVDPESRTETYAAATFFVDNWRWARVPFFLRSGKRLPKRVSDIAIEFTSAPHTVFSEDGGSGDSPNLLVIRIQPNEGISLRFLSKHPGDGMHLRPVSMDFSYGSSFGSQADSAYETLLLDAMLGDATLYTRQDMVDASWSVVQPIIDDWADRKFDFPNYAAGTWGPKESDQMLERQGHHWRVP